MSPKTRLFWFVLAACVIARPAWNDLRAQEKSAEQAPTITAFGTATVDVEPDTLKITFGVQSKLPTVKAARDENDKQVQALKKALAKIKGLEVRTSGETMHLVKTVNNLFNPNPANPAAQAPATDYVTQTTFTVIAKSEKADELRKTARRIVDTALDNGANAGDQANFLYAQNVLGQNSSFAPKVELYKSNLDAARRRAGAMAVKDALANAKAYAEAIDAGAEVKVISVLMVSGPRDKADVSTLYDLYSYFNPEPAQIESTTTTATVKIVCSYRSK